MFASKLIRTSKGFPTKVITLQKMLEILEIPEKGKLMHAYLWVFTFPRKGFHTLGFHTLGATPSSPLLRILYFWISRIRSDLGGGGTLLLAPDCICMT